VPPALIEADTFAVPLRLGAPPPCNDEGAPGGTHGEAEGGATVLGGSGIGFKSDPYKESCRRAATSSWECVPVPNPKTEAKKREPPPFWTGFAALNKFPGGKSSSTNTLVGLAHEES